MGSTRFTLYMSVMFSPCTNLPRSGCCSQPPGGQEPGRGSGASRMCSVGATSACCTRGTTIYSDALRLACTAALCLLQQLACRGILHSILHGHPSILIRAQALDTTQQGNRSASQHSCPHLVRAQPLDKVHVLGAADAHHKQAQRLGQLRQGRGDSCQKGGETLVSTRSHSRVLGSCLGRQ